MKRRLAFFFLCIIVSTLSCGNHSAGHAKLSVSFSFLPTSGTLDAVDLNSLFYETISTSIGRTPGIIDPASVHISISPNDFKFTPISGVDTEILDGKVGKTFAGYVDIVPNTFLPAGSTYSVTTQFTTTVNNIVYPITEYNSFTTVSDAGTNTVGPGSSFIVSITSITQPPSLGGLLSLDYIPAIALNTLTITTKNGSLPGAGVGSMILYGGHANNTLSPTDINPDDFTIPLTAQWNGRYFTSSGSTIISKSGFTIPFQTFNLYGTFNSSGGIDNGLLYAVVHCTDAMCSNAGNTLGPIIAGLTDTNGDMVVLGIFTASANIIPSGTWIGSGDTAHTTLVNGIGSGITTATLEVTTTSSPLITTKTLPFIILTQTDSDNMMSIVAYGEGGPALPQSSPIVLTYPLIAPSGTLFSTTAGTTFTSHYLFGLTPVPLLDTQVIP